MTAQIINLFDRLMAKRMTDAEAAAEAAGQLPATDKLSDRELVFYRNVGFFGRALSDENYGYVSYQLASLASTGERVVFVSVAFYDAYFFVKDRLQLDLERDPIITRYSGEPGQYQVQAVPALKEWTDAK